MKRTLYNFVALFIAFYTPLSFSQLSSHDRLIEMKNSFVLGLTEKGLEIGAELMSRSEYSDVREQATFYIAEMFFLSAINATDENSKIDYASKAYTYYLVLKNDYPSSQFIKTINDRINYLISYFKGSALFMDRLNPLLNESSIVQDKLNFATGLFKFYSPNPYIFFLSGKQNKNSIEILDRYFDEIIVNHPVFEVYAYYFKILAHLSTLRSIDFFEDDILDFDVDKISLFNEGYSPNKLSPDGSRLKLDLTKILSTLGIKYPHHPLILNLHLIFAKVFMIKDGDEIDADTKSHLEFVVQNELDKTNPRYLLAKEFLLSNKFQ